MPKIVRLGNRKDFYSRLRNMARDMIARSSPIKAENVRWLVGPVYVGGKAARYTGKFEDLSTGQIWRFTYFYRNEGRYTVEKED